MNKKPRFNLSKEVILKENSTHKAVQDGNRIKIYSKGFSIEEMTWPDIFLYSIPAKNEDDLFEIFEQYDEENRINVAEFTEEIKNM